MLNEPSNLGWGPESQAQPNSFLQVRLRGDPFWDRADSDDDEEDENRSSHEDREERKRSGQPLENGQPPPGIRGPSSSRIRGPPPNVLGPLPPKGENVIAGLPRPISVQPVPMVVAGDEPQREKQIQLEGGNFVGVKPSSPFVSGNVVDAGPLPTQPLSTSISHRT